MTVPAGAPGDEVPEADWVEQEAGTGPADDSAASVPGGSVSTREADEADLVEQELTVDYSEDEQ